MNKLTTTLLAVSLALACGERKPERGAGMSDMMMKSDSLMPMMRAHLDSLGGMPAQFATGVLAVHDAMMSQMLDAMGADMRMMNMPTDTAWNALTDSIRRDLADLPGLSGRPLETRLRAHVERMRRLLGVHERMMQRHR